MAVLSIECNANSQLLRGELLAFKSVKNNVSLSYKGFLLQFFCPVPFISSILDSGDSLFPYTTSRLTSVLKISPEVSFDLLLTVYSSKVYSKTNLILSLLCMPSLCTNSCQLFY